MDVNCYHRDTLLGLKPASYPTHPTMRQTFHLGGGAFSALKENIVNFVRVLGFLSRPGIIIENVQDRNIHSQNQTSYRPIISELISPLHINLTCCSCFFVLQKITCIITIVVNIIIPINL